MENEEIGKEIVQKISILLRELQKVLPEEKQAKITVPGGVVRTLNEIVPEYLFIKDVNLRTNICYAVQALDFYRWIINRFDIFAGVEGYLFKTGLIWINMIVEAITRDFLIQLGEKPSDRHSKNIKKLRKKGVKKVTCDDIEKLHQRRANLHLFLVKDKESTKYSLKDWNYSVLCLRSFRAEIKNILENHENSIVE